MSRAFASNKSEQMLELLFEEKLYMSNTIDDLFLREGSLDLAKFENFWQDRWFLILYSEQMLKPFEC